MTPAGPPGDPARTDVVTVRYWAAAKAAAGVDADTFEVVSTLADLLDAVRYRHPGVAAVLERSSYLVDGVTPGPAAPGSVTLTPGAVVEVLPPFAGG